MPDRFWWRKKVLERFQYRFWTCCLALTRFSPAVSGYSLGSRPNNSTPARLSALHCVVGRLALCLCLYFTETSCCAAVGTQAV
ncbi:hypothetical protein PHYPO_G00179640 [Pangasianodon hypophthalmus]|uniref:Uncharacterized protein n=1 Tax=Pangasianodon hypophthalmus TaxID=310915 RepID=A0A5N5PQ42_PANHP|nr:hypothetical protein PHYPO_G00179640 [Pangasianodon hypophthalmus]